MRFKEDQQNQVREAIAFIFLEEACIVLPCNNDNVLFLLRFSRQKREWKREMAWMNVYAIPSPSIHYPQIGEDKKKNRFLYRKKGTTPTWKVSERLADWASKALLCVRSMLVWFNEGYKLGHQSIMLCFFWVGWRLEISSDGLGLVPHQNKDKRLSSIYHHWLVLPPGQTKIV